jgi:predicted XRE-type DNA-binding protein
MSEKEEIEHVTGSGNVFSDLGLKDADELFTRGLLGIEIIRILKKRGLKKQKDIAALLGIDKSEASKLMNAEFDRFSEGRLMGFLNKLNYKVTMKISPLRNGEQPQQVIMA